MSDYKQHFNQTLSQHAAAFQAEMDLARSEASNRVLQQENENKRQQLLHQQSARHYQLMLVGLLAGALLLLGLTTHRLHRSSRHLYKLATFDQLTGLPNRRALLERLASRWQQEGPLTLIIIDIDHFKQINDRHGHQAGDRAIQRLARELKILGARPAAGGALGWRGISGSGAAAGGRLLVSGRATAPAHRPPGEQPRMTISIGVAGRSAADDGLGQLIHRADMAMYQAKRQGRNQTMLAAEPGSHEEPEALASSVA
ncbi:GGDEF domain-containing protein [Aeromonas sp. 80P]